MMINVFIIIFCVMIHKVMIKTFIIIFCNDSQSDDKNLYHHLLVLNFTSSDLTENLRSSKMTVKGFSITLWKCIDKLPSFAILGLLVVFLMSHQECHYCRSDLVVIEFTGRSPCTRKDFSSTQALAGKFYYRQVLLTVMYH